MRGRADSARHGVAGGSSVTGSNAGRQGPRAVPSAAAVEGGWSERPTSDEVLDGIFSTKRSIGG